MEFYSNSVSFNDDKLEEKMVNSFYENGFAVINDVFDIKECDNNVNDIMTYFEKLNTGINRNDIKTWKDGNLPPQVSPGLFHHLVCNIPNVWNIRSNAKVRKIFEIVYNNQKVFPKKSPLPIKDFIVSNDGINLRPNGLDNGDKMEDWPHIDQSEWAQIFKIVQGQAVLTNTTASFVCSPKSHHLYHKILSLYPHQDRDSNWLPIETNQNIKQMVIDTGGEWQIPIVATKGSFIIWSSTLIHSGRLAIRKEEKDINDMWKGTRCVVYVCYRPLKDFTERQIRERIFNVEENVGNGHLGVDQFPEWDNIDEYHFNIQRMLMKPKLVYEIVSETKLTTEQLKLVGK
jgi:hypothetical protein